MKYMTVLMFVALLSLTGCIQTPPPKPTLVIQCPPLVTYTPQFQQGFADEVDAMIESKAHYPYIERFLLDAQASREAIRQCQLHAKQLEEKQTSNK